MSEWHKTRGTQVPLDDLCLQSLSSPSTASPFHIWISPGITDLLTQLFFDTGRHHTPSWIHQPPFPPSSDGIYIPWKHKARIENLHPTPILEGSSPTPSLHLCAIALSYNRCPYQGGWKQLSLTQISLSYPASPLQAATYPPPPPFSPPFSCKFNQVKILHYFTGCFKKPSTGINFHLMT